MSWREAKSLLVLLNQVNKLAPLRSKMDDGQLGDAAHAARESDHNPNPDGVVTALDITHDPHHGFDSYAFAEQLINGKDRRIKYVISNHRIASGAGQGKPAWQWRPYTGANPHDHHVHISVRGDSSHYDDETAWVLGDLPVPDASVPIKPDLPRLQRHDSGQSVKEMQLVLVRHGAKIETDGYFGPKTEMAVRAFQDKNGLVADGIVGGATWRKLGVT